MDSLPPPTFQASSLPIIEKSREAYKLWQKYLPDFPRLYRHSLGMKIEQQFLDLLENLLLAGYAVREQKPTIMAKASVKLDLLKFFLYRSHGNSNISITSNTRKSSLRYMKLEKCWEGG